MDHSRNHFSLQQQQKDKIWYSANLLQLHILNLYPIFDLITNKNDIASSDYLSEARDSKKH